MPSTNSRIRNLFSVKRSKAKQLHSHSSKQSPSSAPEDYTPPSPDPSSVASSDVEMKSAARKMPFTQQELDSSEQGKHKKLDRFSAATGLPRTWSDYNALYRSGGIDFEFPPLPPSELSESGPDSKTFTGQYLAPTPLNEQLRQRAVDSLGITRDTNDGASSSARNSLMRGAPAAAPVAFLDACSLSDIADSFPAGTTMSHPALRNLALEAKFIFGTSISTVSIMDNDQQVFLAQSGLGDHVNKFDRATTCCSHAMLKATNQERDPFVVLDLENDWRFKNNNFGESRFYASSPIYSQFTNLGDNTESLQPIGVFCLLDNEARTTFDAKDRAKLTEMAEEAGIEIAKWRAEQQRIKLEKLNGSSFEFRRKEASIVNRAQRKLVNIAESPSSSAPSSPRISSSLESGRRASDPGFSSIATTDLAPCYFRRRKSRVGVHVQSSKQDVSDQIQSVLDIATKLIGETLDLSFTCFLAIDLASESGRIYTRPRVQLLSSHNLPVPTFFCADIHETVFPSTSTTSSSSSAAAPSSALLFIEPDFKRNGGEYEFASGLILNVGTSQHGIGYCLAGYSTELSKVFGREDFLFFSSFADSLRKYVAVI